MPDTIPAKEIKKNIGVLVDTIASGKLAVGVVIICHAPKAHAAIKTMSAKQAVDHI